MEINGRSSLSMGSLVCICFLELLRGHVGIDCAHGKGGRKICVGFLSIAAGMASRHGAVMVRVRCIHRFALDGCDFFLKRRLGLRVAIVKSLPKVC